MAILSQKSTKLLYGPDFSLSSVIAKSFKLFKAKSIEFSTIDTFSQLFPNLMIDEFSFSKLNMSECLERKFEISEGGDKFGIIYYSTTLDHYNHKY